MRPNLVIAVALLVQLGAPLHYYLLRDDPRDERFAWRMFSATRLERCDVDFHSGGAPIALSRLFHPAWIELARRGRHEVVHRMARSLCAVDDYRRAGVSVTVSCEGIERRLERVLVAENVCARGTP